MTHRRTYLAPGQRYMQPGARWSAEQVTIVRLVPDSFGVVRVIFERPGGREVVAFASQVEAAIAAGRIAPIAGSDIVGRC